MFLQKVSRCWGYYVLPETRTDLISKHLIAELQNEEFAQYLVVAH